jgi:hypothetical protein
MEKHSLLPSSRSISTPKEMNDGFPSNSILVHAESFKLQTRMAITWDFPL